MRILVAVKQVWDSESIIAPDESGRRVRPEHPPRFQLNRFDEFAVEEAVLLKESLPGVEVEAVSVGPPSADAVLERARGMGADRSFRVPADEIDPPDAAQTAAALAEVFHQRGADLLLCGVMSEDLMQGLVGPMTAAKLGLPWATSVIGLEMDSDRDSVTVEREIEGGRRAVLEIRLPAVLTLQTGVNSPRYPTLSGLLRAKKEPSTVLDIPPPPGQALETIRVSPPESRRAGIILEGGRREKAAALVRILRERDLLGRPA